MQAAGKAEKQVDKAGKQVDKASDKVGSAAKEVSPHGTLLIAFVQISDMCTLMLQLQGTGPVASSLHFPAYSWSATAWLPHVRGLTGLHLHAGNRKGREAGG
jgi:hypothetical protein